MIDMDEYDLVPLEALRKEERELTEAIETLREQEREARKALRLHYGVTVLSRAYRRSKPGSGIAKVKAAIKNGEKIRRSAERDRDQIRARIAELEAQR